MTKPLARELAFLDMSLMAAKATLADSPAPLADRLTWLGAELERLSGESYRLADEANELSSLPPPDGHKPDEPTR